jgi:hypothetical protein
VTGVDSHGWVNVLVSSQVNISIKSKSQDNSGMIIIVYTTVGKNSERVIFNFFQDKAFKICMYCYNRVMNLKLTWTKEGGYYI